MRHLNSIKYSLFPWFLGSDTGSKFPWCIHQFRQCFEGGPHLWQVSLNHDRFLHLLVGFLFLGCSIHHFILNVCRIFITFIHIFQSCGWILESPESEPQSCCCPWKSGLCLLWAGPHWPCYWHLPPCYWIAAPLSWCLLQFGKRSKGERKCNVFFVSNLEYLWGH